MFRLPFFIVLVLTHPAMAQEWEFPTEEDFKLTGSETDVDHRFGWDVSISDDVLIAGAHQSSIAGDAGPGSAYLFRYSDDDGSWSEEDLLLASDGELNDSFGYSVSVSGDVAVVGAYRDADDGPRSGSAYVFRYDDDRGAWIEEQRLTASDSDDRDQFGRSVAVDGDVIVVGAHLWETGDGSAYVFRFNEDDDEWVEEAQLISDDEDSGGYFGLSVAVSDDVVVVSHENDDEAGEDYGAVHVYRYDPDELEWVEEQKLLPEKGLVVDGFGEAVAVFGDTIVASRFEFEYRGDEYVRFGVVMVHEFDADEGEWVERHRLIGGGDAEGSFGIAVAIAPRLLLVGAYWDDDHAGTAFVFRLDEEEDEWIEVERLDASDRAEGDRFGRSVAVSGELAVIGAFADDDEGNASGSAYVFDLYDPPLFLRGDCDGSGEVTGLPDALYLMRWRFSDGPELPCADAADVDDNGEVHGIVDTLYLLSWVFGDGEEPPGPGPDDCGADATEDDADCDTVAEACS